MKEGPAIFLYDGECGFCNATVLFLLDHTEAYRLAFCPLQSDYARALCPAHGIDQVDLSAAYLFDGTRIHVGSSAVLCAISLSNTPVRLLAAGVVVPKPIRDCCYSVISRVRKRIPGFGRNACRVLAADQRAGFCTDEISESPIHDFGVGISACSFCDPARPHRTISSRPSTIRARNNEGGRRSNRY